MSMHFNGYDPPVHRPPKKKAPPPTHTHIYIHTYTHIYTPTGFTNCVELGWWDEGTLTKRDQDGNVASLRIVCTPAQHW